MTTWLSLISDSFVHELKPFNFVIDLIGTSGHLCRASNSILIVILAKLCITLGPKKS